jgi:ketosteroid isomerase-like protein
MKNALLALALAVFATAPAFASDKDDVMATVKSYNDNFNKGDLAAAVALCTAQVHIIDDFAPFTWQGGDTCTGWATALAAADKAEGISNEKVTLGKPWTVTVAGDRGYAVYPTRYTYKKKGKPVTEQGVWTFALEKSSKGWQIAGWAWSQH